MLHQPGAGGRDVAVHHPGHDADGKVQVGLDVLFEPSRQQARPVAVGPIQPIIAEPGEPGDERG
jgi:hypothetical protein